MSKIEIVLNGRVDRADIAKALLDDGFYNINVLDNYVSNDVLFLDVDTLDATNKEALYKAIDNATYLVEADALIWKVKEVNKEFDLEDSYIRNNVSTATPLTSIVNGTPLKLKVEIPGFLTNNFREIDLWYNQSFNPADVDLLEEIGVTIAGNGRKFTIDNTVECKVSFRKPDSVTDVYIINYDNQIISV